jgi:nitrite reductase (cytochrome c-552)
MPYIRSGSVKISDHWLRSPLANLEASCQTCHPVPVDDLRERVQVIQETTAGLLRECESALLSAIDTIAAAESGGASPADLKEPRRLHREAQMRWDFVSSENGTGFHSPQESARILAVCLDLARQAELKAWQAAGGDLVVPAPAMPAIDAQAPAGPATATATPPVGTAGEATGPAAQPPTTASAAPTVPEATPTAR